MMEAVRILILLGVVILGAYLKHSAQTAVMPRHEMDQEVGEQQYKLSINESFFIRKALYTVASIGEKDGYSFSLQAGPSQSRNNYPLAMELQCID